MQADKSIWNFLRNSTTLTQVARGGGGGGSSSETRTQRDAEVLIVPTEASVRGGEPILLLLPQSQPDVGRIAADGLRYCLVFEGSNRRHLASCELIRTQRALFSRVPEHDIPERVELSVFVNSQRLLSSAFTFTPDLLLGVATDIAEAFPLVPDSLSSPPVLPSEDTDRRLCAALRKIPAVPAAVSEAGDFCGEQRTVFHYLAEAGWLESLAYLLRLTGQPEFWLGQPASSGGPTVLQLVRNPRFHSLLSSPTRLHDWLDQLDGRGSRIQGQEEAVVSVRSWQTPTGASLVIMTTNKEKADTRLEEDLDIFPTLEAGHVDENYLLRSPQTQDPASEGAVALKETACAQTEIGRSIDDLLFDTAEDVVASATDFRADVASRGRGQFAETDSLVLGPTGEMSMSHSMSQSMSHACMSQALNHSMTHSMSQSMMNSGLIYDFPSEEARAGQQQQLQQQQQQQLAASSRSISTPSLFDDLANEQRNRKKRKSFLSRLSGSYRAKGGVSGKAKGAISGSKHPVYEHNWSVAATGKCAVCETHLQRVCLLLCQVCHLTVHNAEACRFQIVSCLPPMAGNAMSGSSPAAGGAAADSGFVSPTSPGCRSFSISGGPLSYLAEVTEEPFRDWKHSGGGVSGNQTLPRNFSNSNHAGATSVTATGDDDAAKLVSQPSVLNRNTRANSVSNDRRGAGGSTMDTADGSGATWQASSTVSVRPTSAMPGVGGGAGGSAVQQLSEYLARLSDPRLEALSSESLRRVASWSETQDRRLLKRCGEKQVRRCNFIYELVSTEVSHLRNICVLRAVFRDPLRLFSAGRDVEELFPHLDKLEHLHSQLLQDLRNCEPPPEKHPSDWPGLGRIGAILRRHLGDPNGRDWLGAYGGFCSEHTLRLQKAPGLLALRWPDFPALLRECERSPLAGRKTLQDYYLMLTQRLSKYKTLFPQISEYCQVAPEDPEMPRACQDLDRLLEGVNATVESSHNRHLLDQIAANFQPAPPEQSSLSAEQLMSRSLLHSGHLRLQTSELKSPVPCFALLLNDMLVFLQELPGGRYSPLACPNRYVPVIHFSETDAIVRENETAKSKATFFVIIKKPDPALINLSCMSLEERNKWLRRINQVRDSNPRADERAVEAERRLRQKSKVSADLLASMEAKDRELRALLNEKSQLWKQLLGLWGPSEPAATPEEGADPDQLLRLSLQELECLRRLLHSAPSFAAARPEASGVSLTRSASNAEDKAAASVFLPKRADTFSGYDSRQQQQQQHQQFTPATGHDEPADGSDILLPPQTPQPPPTPTPSKSAASASTSSLSIKEKNRRPSVFELVFKRPARDAQGSSVSEEDSGGSDPELRQPDAAGLVSLDRLHSIVTGLCRDLLSARTRLAERFKEEARLRQELNTLRAARESEGHRSQDALLETIRLQRADLEAEKNRFRDEKMREMARLETRKEELERKEEKLRHSQEELERQQASLTEQKRTLQMQFDQYNSMRNQHMKSFSDDMTEPSVLQQHQRPLISHSPLSPSPVLAVSTAIVGGGGSLTISSSKGHSKSASSLVAAAVPQQPQMPLHLNSRLVEDRLSRENGTLNGGHGGTPLMTSPTLHAAVVPRLSPSPSSVSTRSATGSATSTVQALPLPLHLAADQKKRKGSSAHKS